MLRASLLSFSAAVLGSGAVFAQTPVTANNAIELPSFAPANGKADHETVAINSKGDVFIVWSSSVFALGGPDSELRRVEGAFLRRTGPTTWDLYPNVILGETDPLALPTGTIFPAGDICRKADVVASGDNFVVAWQRLEAGDTASGRLEAALIEVPSGGGDAIVHLGDSDGIGYVLDTFDPRTAGGMVDLACAPGTTGPIAATYAHRTSQTQIGVGQFAFDFDIRGLTFEFTTPGVAPTVNGINTLASLAFDDFSAGNPSGGRVLPDIVWDPFGNVVMAYEEYRRGERVGIGQPNLGQVHVRRYSVDGAGVFTEVNAITFQGQDPSYTQRRPNLFRSPSNQSIGLAWGEILIPTSEIEVYHWDLAYPNATDDAVLSDFAPVPIFNNISPDVPVPFQYKNAAGVVIATNPNPGAFHTGYQLTSQSDWELLYDFAGKQPWRPALDVLENDPQRNGRGIVVIGTEGRTTTTYSRIFIDMITI